jgi:hypothetical protein
LLRSYIGLKTCLRTIKKSDNNVPEQQKHFIIAAELFSAKFLSFLKLREKILGWQGPKTFYDLRS